MSNYGRNEVTFEILPAISSQHGSEMVEILKSIDIVEIPARFIAKLSVTFKNGITIDIDGYDIDRPIPVKDTGVQTIKPGINLLETVAIYVDLDILERRVNNRVTELFRGKIFLDL